MDVSKKQKDVMQDALQIMNRHYTILAEKLAAEIVENRECFEDPTADSVNIILERHASQIYRLNTVYHVLKWKAGIREKPEGLIPLGKSEFRCFSCGAVIARTDESCRTCGWTWQ